jgi:hypothetical protein
MAGDIVTSPSRGDVEPSDLVWGADEIAAVLNIKPRQVYNLLRVLPVTKVGLRYCASRAALIAYCTRGHDRRGRR